MRNISYVSADLESPLASIRMDLLAAPWKDESFDAIFCNHVLEHIPDDEGAMRELARILRHGGWALLLVPFDPSRSTIEDPEASPEERVKRFGQEDHVRLYGREYIDRLESAGFRVSYDAYAKQLGNATIQRFGLRRNEYLIFGRKSGAGRAGGEI